MKSLIKVGVIFGGRSGEHEVSIVSAQSVIGALDKNKYEIVPIGITKKGQWLINNNPVEILKNGLTDEIGESAFISPDPQLKGIVVLKRDGVNYRFDRLIPIDVIFPVLHGPYGEDGTIQGLFEMADIPYVGAGVLASSCGMDKIIMKKLFLSSGLPVTKDFSFTRNEWKNEKDSIIKDIEKKLSYPVFIKPANLGSSVGISKAHDRIELINGINEACSFDRKILVEAAVENAREIECSVLGNESPVVSVPGEIIPCNEFYDYEAKYVAGKTKTVAPAEISELQTESIRKMAIEAYRSVDCEGMARVDFLLNSGTNEVFVNELNTLPGFTSISMYPKLWETTGIKYSELLDRLIQLALDRQFEKEKTRKGISLESEWYKV